MESSLARSAEPETAECQPGEPGAPSPLERLARLVACQAEGELVCVNVRGEVRLYLQGGRVAWASTSAHRRAFTTHLREHAGLDEIALEQVVAGCVKSRLPIGEALVQSGLASTGQVRAALRHQIELALALATCEREARSSFTKHNYGVYDPRLTFELDELLPLADGVPASSFPGVLVPPPGATANGTRTTPSTEDAIMTATEKLKELQGIEGFAGAAVFTPSGEQLVILEGEVARLKEVGILANNVLLNAQKTSLEMGTGRGQQVHVEGEKAHVLVRCLNEGTDPLKSQPGKAHIHLVLVLKSDASIGLAKMRVSAAVQKLAEDFRF